MCLFVKIFTFVIVTSVDFHWKGINSCYQQLCAKLIKYSFVYDQRSRWKKRKKKGDDFLIFGDHEDVDHVDTLFRHENQ